MTLPRMVRSGLDSKALLGSSVGDAKPGHHFVENQQGAVLPGDGAQSFQEAGLRRDTTHIPNHRFQDHGCNPVLVPGKRFLNRCQPVEGAGQGQAGQFRGDAGAVGQPQGGHPGTCLYQKAVAVAVVASLELQDHGPTREGAGQPQGGHAGFRAGVGEAHLLYRRKRLVDQLGQLHLLFGGGAKAGAGFQNTSQGRHHLRVAVAQNKRTPGAYVVEVAVAVHVVDARPLAVIHEQGVASHGLEGSGRRVDSARNVLSGFLVKLLGLPVQDSSLKWPENG